MFTVTKDYITKHGLNLKNMQLTLAEVNFTNNNYGVFSANEQGEYPSELPQTGGYKTITYRVVAYVSKEGMLAGDLGLPVVLRDGSTVFQIPEVTEITTVSSVVSQCIAHFNSLLN